ncbi:E3 SUMO-protein ligase SIZ1-like isoform X2 [Zingiber officinale]|uniref:E3 SUMO-protein ligase SIZ1-like isoform X2 n=1 Tax=Zingiber officinale TaxID=94328 RepID=UPI001C4AD160|nr:E3 SUMO-protein ligase SIZ1-like isoform X2 [Zingiber officinale]
MDLMDSASRCRDKLTYFRIKELKDVLSQLGLAKHGKKQELMEKILALLEDDQVPKPVWPRRNIGREVVVKIIDDTYRKMQIPGAIDLASNVQNDSEFSHAKSKEVFDSYKQVTKVRCPCGKSLISESMIQCEDMQCRVWQHINCVIIPEIPGDCTPAIPSQFYCEICRIKRADPFWITVKHVLFPVKLPHCGLPDDSTITVQNEERTFQLQRSDKDLLQRHDHSLQVWCLLLNDKVLFRMHWPQFTELQVNGVSVRVVARPGSQLLGINGRDDGSVISTFSVEGVNKIFLSRRDARVFCFGIRFVKRRTVQQVLSLVPKEADGEHFQEALARVRRCVGGGADTENADSDSDIELVADSVTVNLRCPMTGSRIKIAGRFKPCVHLKGFDLEAFVELTHRSRKWQCPICLNNYALENIIIDPYFNRITSMLQNCGEDVTEVNLKPDGSWCVKGEVEYRDLSKWHLPDGTLLDIVDVQAKSDFGSLRHVNQKSPSEMAFTQTLGIKLEANGGLEDNGVSSSRSPILRLENHSQNIINMSSSATGSYKEGEDQSINQEFEGPFNFPLNNGNEFDSFNIRYGTYNIEDGPPAPLEPDVICLSDSDEDNIAVISHEPANGVHADNGNLVPFPTHPKISERYSENPVPETSGTSFLELFNNPGDFGMPMAMPMWSMQTGPPSASNFQLFGTEVLDALDDPHATLDCPPFNGYDLTPSNGEETSQVLDFSNLHPSTAMQESFLDNPLAFTNDDPSLQIFLPNQPISVDLQDDMINQTDTPNGMNSDDWVSLRLTAGGGHSETAPSNGSISRKPEPPNETQMDPLSDAVRKTFARKQNDYLKWKPWN